MLRSSPAATGRFLFLDRSGARCSSSRGFWTQSPLWPLEPAQSLSVEPACPTSNCRIYILPDDDKEGRGAAATWARRLYPRAQICQPDYKGGKDAADLFCEVGADATLEHLNRLAANSTDLVEAETTTAKEVEGSSWKSDTEITE